MNNSQCLLKSIVMAQNKINHGFSDIFFTLMSSEQRKWAATGFYGSNEQSWLTSLARAFLLLWKGEKIYAHNMHGIVPFLAFFIGHRLLLLLFLHCLNGHLSKWAKHVIPSPPILSPPFNEIKQLSMRLGI
jgi:hypothetical protein